MAGEQQRVRILLEQPVRCPPTPEDDAIFEGSKVYVKYAQMATPMGWQCIGRLDCVAPARSGRLRLVSSGDGYAILADVVVE